MPKQDSDLPRPAIAHRFILPYLATLTVWPSLHIGPVLSSLPTDRGIYFGTGPIVFSWLHLLRYDEPSSCDPVVRLLDSPSTNVWGILAARKTWSRDGYRDCHPHSGLRNFFETNNTIRRRARSGWFTVVTGGIQGSWYAAIFSQANAAKMG